MNSNTPDHDFESEAESAPPAPSKKQGAPAAPGLVERLAANPAFRSRLIFLGGAAVVMSVVAYTMFFRTSVDAPLPSDAGGVDLANAPTPEMVEAGASSPLAASPMYANMAREVEERRASAAEKEGATSLPSAETMAPGFKPLPQGADGSASAPIDPVAVQVAEAQAAEAAKRQAADLAAEVARLTKFMSDRQNAWAPARSDEIIRFGSVKMVALPDAAAALQAQAVQVAATAESAEPAKKPNVLASAGTQVAAVTATTCNTDYNSPIFAEVATGALKGSKLVGTCTRANDEALISFSSIAVPGFGMISIQAVAYNPSTNEAGVGTSVDRKLMTKYLLRPIAQGIAAVGEAAKNAGSTTVVVNGAVTTNNAQLDSKRTRQILGGAVADQAAKDLTAGDVEPTVRVAAKHVLSVYFVTDVVAPNN